MVGYVAQRVVGIFPTVFFVSVIVFVLIRMAPGDPAAMRLGREAALEENKSKLEALRHEMGLDQPFTVQYLLWLGDISAGDFGNSLRSKRPNLDLFVEKLPATLELITAASLIAILVSFPCGILAAVRRRTYIDRIIVGCVSAGLAVPSFWFGLAIIVVFSVNLKLLPASGNVDISKDPWGHFQRLIMPATTLAVYLAASLLRFVRADMIETLSSDYVRTAIAKGLTQKVVVLKHGLRNSLVSVLTVAGLEISSLLGGAVIIEQVFGWSGVGWLTVQAIFDRDYPLLQTSVLFLTIGVTLINLVVDIAYGLINPKMRSLRG